jgi:hypothetical protein
MHGGVQASSRFLALSVGSSIGVTRTWRGDKTSRCLVIRGTALSKRNRPCVPSRDSLAAASSRRRRSDAEYRSERMAMASRSLAREPAMTPRRTTGHEVHLVGHARARAAGWRETVSTYLGRLVRTYRGDWANSTEDCRGRTVVHTTMLSTGRRCRGSDRGGAQFADPMESQRGCLHLPRCALSEGILYTRCPSASGPAPRSRDLEMRLVG